MEEECDWLDGSTNGFACCTNRHKENTLEGKVGNKAVALSIDSGCSSREILDYQPIPVVAYIDLLLDVICCQVNDRLDYYVH